jgi:translation initiation factor 2B subunit (eIF-2B alpha/beta/delta family)
MQRIAIPAQLSRPFWKHARSRTFTVHNTETRPRFQGRKTATELAAAGIPVVHFVDSGARLSLKGASALFLGADALLADGKVANKIGSEMLAELAHSRGIPVYILANSWKFTNVTSAHYKKSLEVRDPQEVWEAIPHGVRVENHAFELIEPRYITAVITELGIRDPYTAAKELRQRARLLFPSRNKM